MARRGSNYTPLGKKIARLSRNQVELSKVLSLTQQSVSGKLNGRIAVTLSDLEQLATRYDVPVVYFMSPEAVTVDLARAWVRIMNGPPEMHRVLEIASAFPAPFARQLLRSVEAMHATATHYRNDWLREKAAESQDQGSITDN